MRLLIHVEGQTEEAFVNEVLEPHLIAIGYESVSARLLGNARLRERRGGIKSWEIVKKEISNHLKSDNGAVATIMVDYYALPMNWPMKEQSQGALHDKKAELIENAIGEDLKNNLGGGFNTKRFIPYILMHEFEGLLFSDCSIFASSIGNAALREKFLEISNLFVTPEHINDSPQTAPSKRVLGLMPTYQKVFHGSIAASEIGLNKIRSRCPGFDRWLTNLESGLTE